MNWKIILEVISFVIAVLTVYPTTLWYIGREDKNDEMIKKYRCKMLVGICISIVFYVISLMT